MLAQPKSYVPVTIRDRSGYRSAWGLRAFNQDWRQVQPWGSRSSEHRPTGTIMQREMGGALPIVVRSADVVVRSGEDQDGSYSR